MVARDKVRAAVEGRLICVDHHALVGAGTLPTRRISQATAASSSIAVHNPPSCPPLALPACPPLLRSAPSHQRAILSTT